MRRRKKEQVSNSGSVIPQSVLEFVPSDWPGDSQGRSKFDDHARYQAWRKARQAWARENMDNGVAALPEYEGSIPPALWDPTAI